jgi:hypothetical protein
MTGWNVTDGVSGVVTKVGQSPGIAVVFYDWHLPPSWNSYHTQSMHIKGVWYTLYVVSGHMVVASHPLENHITPSPCILKVFDILYMWLWSYGCSQIDRLEFDGLCKWGCYQSGTSRIAVVFMISTSHPFKNHITPSPCILKVFDIFYMWLVVIWL